LFSYLLFFEKDWRASRNGKTIQELQKEGHQFVVEDNKKLPFKNNSIDEVITSSVPIDIDTFLELRVQSSEIKRILNKKGKWINNGKIVPIK
jgi:organic radical activating enzyme